MTDASARPWPPPPDLPSIKELVQTADVEGYIADGAHPDEYDSEAELLFDYLEDLSQDQLVVADLLPILESVWRTSFTLDDAALATRRTALLALAQQVERFFGPQAKPQVRSTSSPAI
jgi:hypothetical protein